MRLSYTNASISIKRRSVASGNKKQDVTIQSDIDAFISDTGTTADHEQTYLIMFNVADVTSTINPNTDTINDGVSDYKIANSSKKTYNYSVRAIKSL